MTQGPATTFTLPNPEDNNGVWMWDSIHCPRPLPALAADFFARFSIRGTGREARVVNGYLFGAATGAFPTPDAPKHLTPREAWEQHYLPRLSAVCAELAKRDYAALSVAALADEIPAVIDRACDALVDTMLALDGVESATSALADFCEGKLGTATGTTVAQTMLSGSANDSFGIGEKITALAAIAAGQPELAAALRAGQFERIAAMPGAEAFRQAFDEFLSTHGQAVQMWGEIHLPTWAEDPSTPLRMVATYLGGADVTRNAHARTEGRREDGIREFEANLSPDERDTFRSILGAASETIPIMEARARWQLIAAAATRPAIVALGQKLVAAGTIAAPGDVFFLHAAELPSAAAGGLDARGLVESRRTDLAVWGKLTPPATLGVSVPIATLQQIPMLRRFFGVGGVASDTAEVVKGFGASRGVVTGRARVIDELADADGLVAGDILVCPSTSPPWTPYFAIVAAVVTNGGGVLCHAAIEAREYGIPAVVGTRDGTRRIPDGATITVDGELGTVRIEG